MSLDLHNFLQFVLVLESGKRRKPWVRKALVSKVYPFFLPEETIELTSTFTGGIIREIIKYYDVPAEQVTLTSYFAGGFVRETIVNVSTKDTAVLTPSFGGIFLRSKEYRNWEPEVLGLTPSFGGGVFGGLPYEPPTEVLELTPSFGGGSLT